MINKTIFGEEHYTQGVEEPREKLSISSRKSSRLKEKKTAKRLQNQKKKLQVWRAQFDEEGKRKAFLNQRKKYKLRKEEGKYEEKASLPKEDEQINDSSPNYSSAENEKNLTWGVSDVDDDKENPQSDKSKTREPEKEETLAWGFCDDDDMFSKAEMEGTELENSNKSVQHSDKSANDECQSLIVSRKRKSGAFIEESPPTKKIRKSHRIKERLAKAKID